MENVNDASEFFRGKKCIWMEADVVAYKLCDKNYDCERCSFDFIMRNSWTEKTDAAEAILKFGNNSVIDRVIGGIAGISYDNELIYLKNNLVLKHMFGGVYSIGIGEALTVFLEDIDSVDLLPGYGMINKYETLLEISGRWGRKEIQSPMNFTLLQKMKIDPDDLPGDNWFGVISVIEKELAGAVYNEGNLRENNQRIIARLYDYMKTAPEAGHTMLDGGLKCEYLYEILGKEEFSKLLADYF